MINIQVGRLNWSVFTSINPGSILVLFLIVNVTSVGKKSHVQKAKALMLSGGMNSLNFAMANPCRYSMEHKNSRDVSRINIYE